MEQGQPEWREFEALVKRIQQSIHAGAVVTSNEFLQGQNTKSRRQIDIAIRYEQGGIKLLLIVECKNWKTPIDSPEIGSLVSTKRDVGADVAFIVSKKGFTEGAKNLAKTENIRLFTIEDTTKRDWLQGIEIPVVFDVWVLKPTHFSCVNPDGTLMDLVANELKLHEKESRNETNLGAVLRKIWSDTPVQEQVDGGEFGYEYPVEEPVGAKMRIGFTAYKRRFWRKARLDFLGMVNTENNEATMPSLKITTVGEAIPFPDGEIFRDTPDHLARFGLMIGSVIIQPDNVDRDSLLQKATLTVLIDGRGKSLSVNLGSAYAQ